MRGAALGAGLLLALAAAPAAAQHGDGHRHDPASGAFLERAREGTARYQELAVAIADGFRPVGPDAPAMGRHWVHPGRVVGAEYDPAQPAGLTYVTVHGRPALTGVIYVLPLGPGAGPPREPAGEEAWHFHNGDLSEEGLLSGHDPAHGHDAPGLRIAVLHAWVWAANPDGLFAPDNWSLPFARLGLSAPGATPRAARAASLATEEGRAFWASRIRLAGTQPLPGAAEVLRAHGARIGARLEPLEGTVLADGDTRWLEECWASVVRALLAMAAPEARTRLWEVLDAGERGSSF